MAILARLPDDPFAFSDVITFFNRDNPTAPLPLQFGNIVQVGNFPPTGGVGATGFANTTYAGTSSWPTTNPPLQGDTDGLEWAVKTDTAGPGIINVTGRSLTFGQVTVTMTVNGSPGLATGFDVTVRIYNGANQIRMDEGRHTIAFLANVVDGRVSFTLGEASSTTTIQDGGEFRIEVHSSLVAGWSYEITGISLPQTLSPLTFFPQYERLSWYNRGGGIVPDDANFNEADFIRTYVPNTLNVATGNFAIKERIQDDSADQTLTPFGATWPDGSTVSVAALNLPVGAEEDAAEALLGVTFDGTVQSVTDISIQFSHAGGTATYGVRAVRLFPPIELWVEFTHSTLMSNTGVPPADGDVVSIALIDSNVTTAQPINADVSTTAGTVRLSTLRNVNDGVL